MHEVASKAATEESTAGLLKVGDDIASLRAATPPLIAVGGYRVRSRRPRLIRAATIAPLAGKPMPVRGSLAALFAGALSLAVLAGPVTCPTCDPVHADGQLDAERIAAAVSTAAISPAPDRMLDSTPAAAADKATADAGKLPDTTQEPTDKGPPQVEMPPPPWRASPSRRCRPWRTRRLFPKTSPPSSLRGLRCARAHRTGTSQSSDAAPKLASQRISTARLPPGRQRCSRRTGRTKHSRTSTRLIR